MLLYVLDTLINSIAGLPQSGLSRSQDSTTSSGPGGTVRPRQPGARINQDPTVFKSVYPETLASSEFRYTYTQSISSTQTITQTIPNSHLRAYYYHKRQWDRLPTEKYLKWDMFPWPVLKQPMNVDDITADAVKEYLDVLYQFPQNMFGSMEEYVADHIERWNYDRMDAKVFVRVHVGHRKKVEESVLRVGNILRVILRREQESG
jgi:uncharacterized membrane protein